MRIIVITLVLLLTACENGEFSYPSFSNKSVVNLKNPKTKTVQKCSLNPRSHSDMYREMDECTAEYERKGYVKGD
jgi:hypothetical protein